MTILAIFNLTVLAPGVRYIDSERATSDILSFVSGVRLSRSGLCKANARDAGQLKKIHGTSESSHRAGAREHRS